MGVPTLSTTIWCWPIVDRFSSSPIVTPAYNMHHDTTVSL